MSLCCLLIVDFVALIPRLAARFRQTLRVWSAGALERVGGGQAGVAGRGDGGRDGGAAAGGGGPAGPRDGAALHRVGDGRRRRHAASLRPPRRHRKSTHPQTSVYSTKYTVLLFSAAPPSL